MSFDDMRFFLCILFHPFALLVSGMFCLSRALLRILLVEHLYPCFPSLPYFLMALVGTPQNMDAGAVGLVGALHSLISLGRD